ncbi:polysaccharide biosynthesis/export family protein [Paracoccus sp. p4-l81]|uniref:polysaccharide biosynthesis/export family protein n=1 Tax=unclassified Paracoccus (in: a-proteobacteria) TaxID=2688777 RepID=UPI0035BA5A07
MLGVLVTALAACGLPRSGPTRAQLIKSSVTAGQGGTTHVVDVTHQVARITATSAALGFGSSFRGAGAVGADEIRPGDVLGLGVWENVDDGLLSSMGTSSTELREIQVDSQGYIFVPYAGRIRAAGNSPEALRQLITNRLSSQTPDPQVTVTRVAGDGATVSVMGKIGGQGVYPIERPTRTLSAMLSKAGGVTIEPDVAQITVKRGGTSGRVWLSELYSNPANDIALRPGDVILVEEDKRTFQALGALGGQQRMKFDTKDLSALDAVSMVGGLSSASADPTGVFVLREEGPNVASQVLGQPVSGAQRMAYILDLTKPDGLFVARDFIIRDGDTLYVTEAPYTQWQKTIGALTGSLGTANTLRNLSQ